MTERVWIVAAMSFSLEEPLEIEGRLVRAFTEASMAEACALMSSSGEEVSKAKTWSTECVRFDSEIPKGAKDIYVEFYVALQRKSGKAMMRLGEIREWQEEDAQGKSESADVELQGMKCLAYRAVTKMTVDRGRGWVPKS